MFGALDTSTSALVANRQRMEIIAANMANINTTHDPDNNYAPFRRRLAILAAGDPATGNQNGVHVREIKLDYGSELRKVHDPGHPDADADGYVYYPNIEPANEMVNALEASRAYEANITAAEATKSMLQASLRMLA
jgi:flagellar basal-body rod protein FlgC